MFNRVFLVLIALILTINTSMANTHSGIKAAFDEFQYVMQVEGAALDPEKTQEALLVLQEQLKGADRKVVMEVALAGVTDKRLADEIQYAVNTIETQKLSNQEATQLMTDILERGAQRGASWNVIGDVLLGIVAMAGMLMLALGLLYVAARSSDCPTNYNEEQCRQWNENVKW